MRDDRELLELAAKAAQHCMDYMRWDGYRFVEQKVHGVPHCGLNYEKTWNPLADDGDALRLSVKLNIHIRMWVYACEAQYGKCESTGMIHASDCGGDVVAATRRAIVRAAASIGEAMQ